MWLGVDGGGTKTGFALYDDDMRLVDSFELGTCHCGQVGFDGMQRVLEEGLSEAIRRGLTEPYGIGLGICAYGGGEQTSRRMFEVVAHVAGNHPFELVNDVQAAHAASLGSKDGIVVIAGTGSVAYGVHGEASMRCGGWDYQIGDEGSGYWMGKELVRAYSFQADGRSSKGPLYDIVKSELGLKEDYDLIDYMRNVIGNDRTKTASLSKLVSKAASKGDRDAQLIFSRAAQEEARMIKTIATALFPDAPEQSIPVSYVGGTFKAGQLIFSPLKKSLPLSCVLVKPVREPAVGGCLLLRKRLNR